MQQAELQTKWNSHLTRLDIGMPSAMLSGNAVATHGFSRHNGNHYTTGLTHFCVNSSNTQFT